MSSARDEGETAIWFWRGQPTAEIVRVECAKRRRECNLARATLCGDRACRGREMQARVRFVSVRRNPLCGDRACRMSEMQARVQFGAGNPLRRSCVSRARNAGESAICLCPAQPSVRRSCVSNERNAGESAFWIWRGQPSAEIVRVDFVVQLEYAEQSVELEAENWRLCSTI